MDPDEKHSASSFELYGSSVVIVPGTPLPYVASCSVRAGASAHMRLSSSIRMTYPVSAVELRRHHGTGAVLTVQERQNTSFWAVCNDIMETLYR